MTFLIIPMGMILNPCGDDHRRRHRDGKKKTHQPPDGGPPDNDPSNDDVGSGQSEGRSESVKTSEMRSLLE